MDFFRDAAGAAFDTTIGAPQDLPDTGPIQIVIESGCAFQAADFSASVTGFMREGLIVMPELTLPT